MIFIKLQYWVDKQDLSIRQLSKVIGIRADTLQMYCRNEIQRINVYDLDKLCKYFNINLSSLMEFMSDDKKAIKLINELRVNQKRKRKPRS